MTRFQQYIVAVAVAAAVGILVAVVLHGRAAAAPGLHYAPCPGRTPAWSAQLPAPLPSCLYPGG